MRLFDPDGFVETRQLCLAHDIFTRVAPGAKRLLASQLRDGTDVKERERKVGKEEIWAPLSTFQVRGLVP
jgi:hypothetical protein